MGIGTPTEIALEEIALKPTKESFTQSDLIFGVLLEGNFNSAYSNRTKPVRLSADKQTSVTNQMIVISDGDLIANEILRGEPLPLDKDKWTGKPYGNLQFLMNATQYLTGDQGIMALRSKTIKLQFLDKERAYQEQTYWQWLNIILPIILLLAFGFIYNFIRNKRYGG
jgi:gliding-associated putative ABC transporter substrate-binding component GldG